jgi:hypothetical protein
MRTDVLLCLQAMRRSSAFLDEEVDVPAKMGPITGHLAEMKQVTEELAKFASEQEVNTLAWRKASYLAKELAKALAAQYVRPVYLVGKRLYPRDYALRAALLLPRSGNVSYGELITAAEGIVSEVEARKAEFVKAGFGEDFLERIRGAIVALRNALEEQADSNARRTAATAGMMEAYGQGRQMLRLLNTMVAPILEGADRKAHWKRVSRVTRSSKPEEADVVAGENTNGTGSTPNPQAVVGEPVTPSPAPHAA